MDLDWYCIDMLKKRHQCRCGILWTFSSLKRQRSPHQYVWFHTFNFRQNKVVIVISVISKILNPSKCWMVTIQLLLNDTLFYQNLYCLLPVVIVGLLFVSVLLFDSVFSSMQWLCSIWIFCSVSNYSAYALSWSWKCIPGISIPLNINYLAIKNIVQQTERHLLS